MALARRVGRRNAMDEKTAVETEVRCGRANSSARQKVYVSARMYRFPIELSSTRPGANSGGDGNDEARDRATLAEAERRRTVIRTYRIIERNERRGHCGGD